MSKEKQIDEMANNLYGYFIDTKEDCKFVAKLLILKGYRKQSEGEWIDQYNGKCANPIYVCSVCRKGTLLKPHINELDNIEMIQALSPFCPKCGAKMKGGTE